jgi:hypothetical protein
MAQEHIDAATRIVRALTGGRWSWPPVRVRELYPAPSGKLLLRGRPVREVVSVRRYSDQVDLDYTLFRNGVVELADQVKCRGGDARVDVVYEYGSAPSAMLQNAIDALAAELVLADAQSAECRLPEQVTSVNRQGLSWSIVDPSTFLDRGRTGIFEIDLAIAASTGGTRVRARSKVFSPDFPPPERIETEVLSVPATP